MSDFNGHSNGSTRRTSPFPPGWNDGGTMQMPLPVANAVAEIVANFTASRQEWFRQLMDPRRNLEDECGYPPIDSTVPVELFRQLYDREPIPARVAQCMPKESWQLSPLVYEDDSSATSTDFEHEWDELGRSLSPGGGRSWHQQEEGSPIWEHLIRGDILSRIGHFGLVLLGVDDGKGLETPLDGAVSLPGHLTNSRRVPVLDADGRQVGVKVSPVTLNSLTSPPIPDGFLTQEQEDRLLEDRAWDRQTWNAKGGLEIRPGTPLTVQERDVVAGWAEERRQVENAIAHPGATETLAGGRATDGSPSPVSNDNSPTFSTASRSDGTSPFDMVNPPLSGYDDRGGGSSYLAGTDSQYYGVHFGPTQMPGQQPSKAKPKLLFIRCFDESLVQVVRYEWNIRNPRFGMPVMYRVTLHDPRSAHTGVGLPLATVFVHWSRVIHLADVHANASSSEIFAPPVMQPVLNRLLDLRKLYGAAAEGFWKSCFSLLSFETHPQLGGEVVIDKAALKDMYEQVFNGLQRALTTTGMEVKSISPTVTDPTGQIAIQLEAVCIQLGIPVRVFKGSERGELASSQDDASWNDRVNQRRHGYNTPRIIVPFIDRLIQIGVLPEPEGYSIEWPDLDSQSDAEKATIANTKLMALSAYVTGGLDALVTPMDLFTRFFSFTEEEALLMLQATEQLAEENQQAQQDAMDEQAAQAPMMGGAGEDGLAPPMDAEVMGPDGAEAGAGAEEEGGGDEAAGAEGADSGGMGAEAGGAAPGGMNEPELPVPPPDGGEMDPAAAEGVPPADPNALPGAASPAPAATKQLLTEEQADMDPYEPEEVDQPSELDDDTGEPVSKAGKGLFGLNAAHLAPDDVSVDLDDDGTHVRIKRDGEKKDKEQPPKPPAPPPAPVPPPKLPPLRRGLSREDAKRDPLADPDAGRQRKAGPFGMPLTNVFNPEELRDRRGKWTKGVYRPGSEGIEPKPGRVAKHARVGVPAMSVPPPPKIGRLPNLTPAERKVEDRFISAFEAAPDKVAADFLSLVKAVTKPGEAPVFGTDDAKALTGAWSSPHLPTRAKNRATLNLALHQTANAIAKRAFLQHLDTLKPGDEVMVTAGGCGAGKGFAIKNVPEALELKQRSKAVWDSAGDQNATENPWVQKEAEKRGLTVHYVYVHADPRTQWAHPERGVVKRAADPNDGRMVDAKVFADSYALGAKNMAAFHRQHKDNPSASFTFISNTGKQERMDGIPAEALNIDRRELAEFAMTAVRESSAPTHVIEGATAGARIWSKKR